MLKHVSSIYDSDNTENLFDTIVHDVQNNKEKVQKNLSYLGELNSIFVNLQDINNLNLEVVQEYLKEQNKALEVNESAEKLITFGIGV